MEVVGVVNALTTVEVATKEETIIEIIFIFCFFCLWFFVKCNKNIIL
jgi:hypothetical protein